MTQTRRIAGLTAGKVIILILLTLLLILLSSVFFFLNFYKPTFSITEDPFEPDILVDDEMPPETGDTTGTSKPTVSNSKTKSDFYNILVVCSDDGANTDTIMVVSLDVKNKESSIIQIPRDTYTNSLEYYSVKKINASYAYGCSAARKEGKKGDEIFTGGIDYLKKMIRNTFGIAVHCYVYMDLAGFREIVDIVGGVTVEVEFDMKYDDPYQDLHINLAKGTYNLNGDQAEQFMRWRKNNYGGGYVEGDIGRLKAQQRFLSALIKKSLKFDINQITKFIDAGYKYIKTDLSVAHVLFFAKEFLKLSAESITMYTVPGEGQYIGNLSYYLPYREEMLEIVNANFNAYKEDLVVSNLDLPEFNRAYAEKGDVDGAKVSDFNN